MRLSGQGILLAGAVAAWLLAALLAALFVSRVGFLGIGIIGTLMWFICVRVELEKDAAVGDVHTTDLYARQIRARHGQHRSERASRRHEQAVLVHSLAFFRMLAIGLTVIGFAMFFLFEL